MGKFPVFGQLCLCFPDWKFWELPCRCVFDPCLTVIRVQLGWDPLAPRRDHEGLHHGGGWQYVDSEKSLPLGSHPEQSLRVSASRGDIISVI